LPLCSAPAPVGTGRGERKVNLAITSPMAAHRAASASNCVPISRRFSGEVFATAAVPLPGPSWVSGLGVTAEMLGRIAPTFPPALGATSGREPPARSVMPSPVAAGRPAVPAVPAGRPDEAAPATAAAATVNTAVVRTGFLGLGLAAVTATVSRTCSPAAADVGTATAARNSICEAPTVPSLQVFVPSPLPQTVKLGVAAAGLVLSEAVTPVEAEPEEDTRILKFAEPPGLTLVLPGSTPTLSHSFTCVGEVAIKAASDAVGVLPDVLEVLPDVLEVLPDVLEVVPDVLGDGVDAGADGVALPDVPPPVPVGEPPLETGDPERVGVGVAEVVGDEVGDEEDGGGLGFSVDVTQGTGTASGRAVPLFSSVNAVVPSTPALTHKAVAMVAKTDPCLRTLTWLTPFLRWSLEGSSFTPYRHTMSYP
jgi:hypothetical protein